MGLFDRNNRKGGFMDEIRCDEPSYLIWKWHPSGSQAGANNRENAIRWGSSLRVKDGEVAVFVYKQKDGTMQDFIVGPFDQTIKTANFPVLADVGIHIKFNPNNILVPDSFSEPLKISTALDKIDWNTYASTVREIVKNR